MTRHPWLRVFLLAWVFAQSAGAFTLTPISLELEPSGRGASGTFRLENKGAEREAVQISVARREISEDGLEQLTPAGDQFEFFPKKVFLEPRKFQIVRITWKGPAQLAQELAFRIIAEQLPVDTSRTASEGGKVRLMLKYQGSLYVKPRGAKPSLKLESIRWMENSTSQLEVTIANTGNAHGLLNDFKLFLAPKNEDRKIELTQEQLKTMAGNNILPQTKRKFVVPAPAGISPGDITGSLSWDSTP